LLSSSIIRSGGSAQVDDDKDDVDNDDAILSQRDLCRENDDDMHVTITFSLSQLCPRSTDWVSSRRSCSCERSESDSNLAFFSSD